MRKRGEVRSLRSGETDQLALAYRSWSARLLMPAVPPTPSGSARTNSPSDFTDRLSTVERSMPCEPRRTFNRTFRKRNESCKTMPNCRRKFLILISFTVDAAEGYNPLRRQNAAAGK